MKRVARTGTQPHSTRSIPSADWLPYVFSRFLTGSAAPPRAPRSGLLIWRRGFHDRPPSQLCNEVNPLESLALSIELNLLRRFPRRHTERLVERRHHN